MTLRPQFGPLLRRRKPWTGKTKQSSRAEGGCVEAPPVCQSIKEQRFLIFIGNDLEFIPFHFYSDQIHVKMYLHEFGPPYMYCNSFLMKENLAACLFSYNILCFFNICTRCFHLYLIHILPLRKLIEFSGSGPKKKT